mgnify:CR=1 FL=1
MTIHVNFRVVGIYCYFPNLVLDLEPSAYIKDVHDKIVEMDPKPHNGIFEIIYSDEHETDVDGFKYEFRTGSTTPYDAEFARPKVRHLKENVMENGELQEQYTTWQYYVSANFSKTHDSSENNSIDLIVGRNPIPRNTTGGIIQPPFYDTRLNSDLPTEIDGYELKSYNIIWRLLTIGSDPESTNSVQALIKERRRRRTSGRIV